MKRNNILRENDWRFLTLPIEDLNLPKGMHSLFKNWNGSSSMGEIKLIGDLVYYGENLLSIPRFGRGSMLKLHFILDEFGISPFKNLFHYPK